MIFDTVIQNWQEFVAIGLVLSLLLFGLANSN